MGTRKPEFTVIDKTVAYGVVATYQSLLIPQNVEHLLKIYSSFQAPCLGDWCSPYLPLLSAFPLALPVEGRVVGSPASTAPKRALPCPAFLSWSITFSQWVLLNSPLRGAPLSACVSTGRRRTRMRSTFHGLPLLLAVFYSILSSQEKAACLPSPWDQQWEEVWMHPWQTNLMRRTVVLRH